MTVGELKALLKPLDDDLPIIVVGEVEDEDGDESEVWFSIRGASVLMDSDTAEDYARFECVPIEDETDADG